MQPPESLRAYFSILNQKRFTEQTLDIDWEESFPEFPPAYQQWEYQFWETARQNDEHLTDNPLCQLRKIEENGQTLHLTLGPIQFRSHYFYIKKARTLNLPFDILPVGLGVSAVVISSDNQILFMKRSQRVATYKGAFDVFGGHIPVSGEPHGADPFAAIEKELEEEIGLPADQIAALTGLGLIRNEQTGQPELVFLTQTRVNAASLTAAAQQASDNHEYSHIIQIPNNKDKLLHICQKYASDFSPSGLGSLWLLAVSENEVPDPKSLGK